MGRIWGKTGGERNTGLTQREKKLKKGEREGRRPTRENEHKLERIKNERERAERGGKCNAKEGEEKEKRDRELIGEGNGKKRR